MATTINWPSTLPQDNIKSGFSATLNSGVIRTNMSTGYAKIRKKFTKVYRRYLLSYEIDVEQYYDFITFFETELGYGVSNFNLPDPLKVSETIECRIVSNSGENPYQISPLEDSDDLQLSFVVEKL